MPRKMPKTAIWTTLTVALLFGCLWQGVLCKRAARGHLLYHGVDLLAFVSEEFYSEHRRLPLAQEAMRAAREHPDFQGDHFRECLDAVSEHGFIIGITTRRNAEDRLERVIEVISREDPRNREWVELPANLPEH